MLSAYGTTGAGGVAGNGTLFRVGVDGTGFAIVKNFSASTGNTNFDGANPYDGLVLTGSTFYGTTAGGGSSGSGTVFKIDLAPQVGISISNFVSQIALTNYFGQSVQILAATNVSGSWDILTNFALTGTSQFSDFAATNFTQRFYRALSQ